VSRFLWPTVYNVKKMTSVSPSTLRWRATLSCEKLKVQIYYKFITSVVTVNKFCEQYLTCEISEMRPIRRACRLAMRNGLR